jgi:hypothetical protein
MGVRAGPSLSGRWPGPAARALVSAEGPRWLPGVSACRYPGGVVPGPRLWYPGTMAGRYAKALARLGERLRGGPGELAPAARAAAIDGGPLPGPLAQRYVQTVGEHAYQLTGRSLEELAEAGWTDGQVFELTVAAASGAARRRLDAGLAALGQTAGWRRPAGEG